jgi:hypothetical protein
MMTPEEINALAKAIAKQLDFPTKAEILKAIIGGIALELPLLGSSEIYEAISKGIRDSMPWPSEILGAIGHGVEEAHRK